MNFNLPLRLNNAVKQSYHCHYEVFNSNNNCLDRYWNRACHSRIKHNCQIEKGCYVILYLSLEALPYSLTSLLRWLSYLRTVGFKAKFIEKKQIETSVDEDNPYLPKLPKDYYLVRFNYDDYLNKLHLYAAITAFRYIYYSYSANFIEIPQRVFELKKIYGDRLCNLKALSVAYYTLKCTEYGHAFIASPSYYINLVSLEQFNERIKEQKELNYVLENGGTIPTKAFYALYTGKEYNEIAKLIEI